MSIQEYAKSRGIRSLIHFTRKSNIASILQHGLVRRDILVENGFSNYNDKIRADYTSAICTTISFPNYKMFYRLQMENPAVEWAVIEINPSALWELDCAFCVTNAASASVTGIPIEQRKSLESFRSMFGNASGKIREELNIPNEYATDPQAEVLFINGIPREYIMNINVKLPAERFSLMQLHKNIDIWYDYSYFSPRKDYSHWK